MEIIKQYGITDKREKYNMLNAPGTSMSDIVGQRIEVAGYVLMSDVDSKTGEIVRRLKVKTKDGEYIGTTSPCFIEGMLLYLTMMETDELNSFEIGTKKSKAGRNYICFIA